MLLFLKEQNISNPSPLSISSKGVGYLRAFSSLTVIEWPFSQQVSRTMDLTATLPCQEARLMWLSFADISPASSHHVFMARWWGPCSQWGFSARIQLQRAADSMRFASCLISTFESAPIIVHTRPNNDSSVSVPMRISHHDPSGLSTCVFATQRYCVAKDWHWCRPQECEHRDGQVTAARSKYYELWGCPHWWSQGGEQLYNWEDHMLVLCLAYRWDWWLSWCGGLHGQLLGDVSNEWTDWSGCYWS